MTTEDENHSIIRSTGKRLGQGLVIIVGIMIFGAVFTTIYWQDLASTPPPVSTLPAPAVEPLPPLSETTQSEGSGQTGSPANSNAAAPTGTSAAPPASGPTLIALAGSATQGNPDYDPDPLSVKVGESVTVQNEDTVPHTVTSGEAPGGEAGQLFDTSLIDPAGSATLDTSSLEAGEYPYHCMVHPYMKGVLTVQ